VCGCILRLRPVFHIQLKRVWLVIPNTCASNLQFVQTDFLMNTCTIFIEIHVVAQTLKQRPVQWYGCGDKLPASVRTKRLFSHAKNLYDVFNVHNHGLTRRGVCGGQSFGSCLAQKRWAYFGLWKIYLSQATFLIAQFPWAYHKVLTLEPSLKKLFDHFSIRLLNKGKFFVIKLCHAKDLKFFYQKSCITINVSIVPSKKCYT